MLRTLMTHFYLMVFVQTHSYRMLTLVIDNINFQLIAYKLDTFKNNKTCSHKTFFRLHIGYGVIHHLLDQGRRHTIKEKNKSNFISNIYIHTRIVNIAEAILIMVVFRIYLIGNLLLTSSSCVDRHKMEELL